jgi:thiamine-phosphate pyrophosphorylase
MPQSSNVLRIIDANLNRLGEGLRFLEEIARFVLNDETITAALKNLRHELLLKELEFKLNCRSSRDSETDVGYGIELNDPQKPRNIIETVIANACRAQESLRVLEELAKMQDSPLDFAIYQTGRFKLYALEKQIISRIRRLNKARKITGLYALIDTDSLGNKSHIEVGVEILAGGTKIIQLRDKTSDKKKLLNIAHQLKNACNEYEALFIVNDHLDIALATDADGLHLGQEDLPVSVARRFLPIDKLIGCSVENVTQASYAKAEGADYLACGAVYTTPTKPECKAIGCQILSAIKKEVDLPVVAIGGIKPDNLGEVMRAGADSVAIISAILSAESARDSTREIIQRIELYRESTIR